MPFFLGFDGGSGFWWSLRKKRWSLSFAKCKFVLKLNGGNKFLLCWKTRRWGFVCVRVICELFYCVFGATTHGQHKSTSRLHCYFKHVIPPFWKFLVLVWSLLLGRLLCVWFNMLWNFILFLEFSSFCL